MQPTTEPAFTNNVHTAATGPVIEATGELDLDGAPVLHAALRRALTTGPPGPDLVIDLAGVTFCDSSGLNALLRTRIETGRASLTLHLARPAPAVAKLLKITGVDRVFPVDRNEAPVPCPRTG
ncbi:anti-sigma factor antagonist [Kitasatospora herbaricolor]|uniref:STAS domain-containing protein n=1 Tax=Kitasatospora herbaricolor TaxID=68217 RepID=UPI0019CC7B20|nr:STAS domain-containing protein [Kitasatospora herbaricolor]MDQ0305947.1 anti-anti-sigma factor [Kitasatospora herbaricolor]GGV49938.1 anti-sigma factor antagonist [Kitasatospora herbaricolor]